MPVYSPTPAGPVVPMAPAVPVVPVMAMGYAMSPTGAPVAIVEPPRSKAAAAVLCFFLGWLGVHRFYTGQAGIGAAQLLLNVLLFWTLIVPLCVGVWVFVDFILILTGGVKDKYGRPLA